MKNPYKPITIWLYSCCFLIILMVFIGGITRLTGSGLSIVEWQPVTGIIPPLNLQQWQGEFAKYQQSPEYIQVNNHMTLSNFKFIYLLEYSHRLLGRIAGIIFILPFIYFLCQGHFTKRLTLQLCGIFILGGIEGGLGWYMVSSGLSTHPEVSQYRLALHLGFACIIFAAVWWITLNNYPYPRSDNYPLRCKSHAALNIILIFLQIVAGAFVAGLHAGLIYNSFPLMDGHLVPDSILILQPLWRNFFENTATVQFLHRILAMIILVSISYFYWRWKSVVTRKLQVLLNLVALIVVAQFSLGILTLVYQVPIILASMHQLGAILLFAVAIAIYSSLFNSNNKSNTHEL
jgi:cytochrome c oxidase assembly protein subunit 15